MFVAGGIPTDYTKHEPIETNKEWYCPLWELREHIELELTVNQWLEIKYPNYKLCSKEYNDSWSRKNEHEFDLEVLKRGIVKKNFWDKI